MKSAVIFERDGVLNEVRVEGLTQMTPRTLEELNFNENVFEPLLVLKAAGFLLLATTNQPGLSRGDLCRRELDLMHSHMRQRLGLDDILVCPHDETDGCPCRKPKPGLLYEAAFKWKLDPDRCYVVSDKWQDAEAAHNAGYTSLLIRSPWNGSGHRDFILPDIYATVRKILQIQLTSLGGGKYDPRTRRQFQPTNPLRSKNLLENRSRRGEEAD